jgi:hypothetical protein
MTKMILPVLVRQLACQKRRFTLALAASCWTLPIAGQNSPTAPVAVFVTWDGDPTTSVSIDWHLAQGSDVRAVEIRGPGIRNWNAFEGTEIQFPFSSRTVRRAKLTGLRPDATYELRVGASPIYRYRTLPARLTRHVRFAVGGDTRADSTDFGPMNRIVASRDVDFVVFGGDLAYSNGDPRLVAREESWFETITRTLVARNRRLIPVIVAIGNHEVYSNRSTSPEAMRVTRETGVHVGDAPYFTALHAHARPPHYSVIDVSDYLSLVLLNSGHTAPVSGAQTDWLREVLSRRVDVPHVFPVYHVPGYPSVRTFSGNTSRLVRENWSPLFERNGIRVAFENHDHIYKRSYPISGGRRDSTGVVYLGDGSWGAPPRRVGRDQAVPAWYIERSASVNHGIIVTLDGTSERYEVVDTRGRVFDTFRMSRRRPAPSSPPIRSSSARQPMSLAH